MWKQIMEVACVFLVSGMVIVAAVASVWIGDKREKDNNEE